MRRPFPAFLAGLALLLTGQAAMALGLGRVSTQSYLGNPLEFSIAVSAVAGDALAPECISAEVFAGDSRVPPEMVRVRVNRNAEGTPTSLRIVTGTRIDEPVASVDLTLDCGIRVSRRYVVFVDPPIVNMAQAEGGDSVAVPSAAPRRPLASRDLAPSSSQRRARAERSTGTTVQAGGTGTASAARQRRIARAEAARTARAAAAAAAPAERGSRLKLESAPAIAAGAPVKERTTGGPGASTAASAAGGVAVATAGAALGAAAASAPPVGASGAASAAGLLGELAAKAEADALALNAERLRALEDRMNRLRSDNANLQKSMVELQTRLAEAEATRYANPLVYGLVAALALLLLAVIVLLWRQAGLRKESEWLKAAAADSGGDRRTEPRVPATRSAVTPSPRGAAAAALAAGTAAAASLPSRTIGEETSPAAALRPPPDEPAASEGAVVSEASPPPPAPAPAPAPVGPHESTSVHQVGREVTVEELIDLEQQADFFVVLGQDDAAIDLLMGHVQGTGGASPLPYLKLLEIHRRRDEREAYDRVRERFNRRFSAFAPEWDAHSGHDRALEDYPAVVERLQGVWPEPTKAMEALSGLLFQRDLTAQTFDLPAYGELLFLYSLARERAEHEPPPDGVDLLLPLDDGPASGGGRAPVAGVAAALGAAAAAGAAGPAMARADDLPSLDPLPLSDLPASLGPAPEVPPTYPVPLTLDPAGRPSGADDGLLDLNISDDPEEPKGPLSKW